MNAVGKCVAVTGNYDAALDFRAANASNNSSEPRLARLQFRASDAAYCDIDDALCAQCRISVFPKVHFSSGGGGNSSSPVDPVAATTAFCYGNNNCVCIAACESTRWSENVGGTKCPGSGSDLSKSFPPSDDGGMKAWEITLIVIAVLLAILIAAVCLKGHGGGSRAPISVLSKMLKRCRKEAPEQVADPDAAGRVEAGGAAKEAESDPKREGLSLFGWRSMREELIGNENHRLARVDEERTPGAGFIQFSDTAPSAPCFEDEMGSFTTDLVRPSAPFHEL